MDVNVLPQAARTGLDGEHFTLLVLSLAFWANGGLAEAWDLGAFTYGQMTLSGSDILVLAWTLDDLQCPKSPLHHQSLGAARSIGQFRSVWPESESMATA